MVQVVWFKRDLRVTDHAPLAAAANAGAVLPLYIVEPDYWALPETSGRQFDFIAECLEGLQKALNGKLVIRIGSVTDVLQSLDETHQIDAMHSHEETGNSWTFERDKAVAKWCAAKGITWHEYQNFGVKRPLDTRDRWAKYWEEHMTAPTVGLPDRAVEFCIAQSDDIPSAHALGLDDPCSGRQPGGRTAALDLLNSFFDHRGRNYQREMSSPATAARACSRLSPHIAYGTLSLREIVHRAYAFRVELAEIPKAQRPFDLRAVDAFIARLHWHCHFIQKLEDEPQIEHQTFHPAFQNARVTDSNDSHLRAWATGQTGWPFVDACMRSLMATGWINFRVRAMLTAIASYHLWLDWRESGKVLARYFVDYEPGIHWSQIQMQSGTTAINTMRMYNPVKQSRDQDPDGAFIRKWVPELANVPDDYVHEPWTMPPLLMREIGFVLGETYPAPIVDQVKAAKEARAKITAIRNTAGFRENQLKVLQKHGSRKGKRKTDFPSQERMIKRKDDDRQLKLDF